MTVYKSIVSKINIPIGNKIKQKHYLPKGLLPVIDQGKELIGGYTNDISKQIDCETPVIVFGDHTKNVKYINFPFCAGADGIKILKARNNVKSKYLYYGTQYLTYCIEDKGYARHYQFIEKKEIPLPPLAEQERIVAKIEELFSELDSAITELKNVKEKVEFYCNSLVNSVVHFTNTLPIRSCIITMGQGWSPKCENTNVLDDEQWAVIKTTAIQPRCFCYKENKKLPSTLSPKTQHEIKVDDILITRAGPRSRCGVCCLVKETKQKLLNCDKVYCLKVDKKIVFPQYLELILNSPEFLKKIDLCKTGGNESGLNLTQDRFLNIEIPISTIQKQQEIIDKVDEKLSVCKDIEKTIDITLSKTAALRQSILKQAFEGKL